MREEWMLRAACGGMGIELFFPDVHRPGAVHYRTARAVCASCPVAVQCLEFALRTEGDRVQAHNRFGVWGGTTPAERTAIQKQRNQGRKRA